MSRRKATLNTVADSMEVFGTLTTDLDLRIEGVVMGDAISRGHLTLAPGGRVMGSLIARTAEVQGFHGGDIDVKHHVLLTSTSRVLGTLECRSVTIERGALLHGLLRLRRHESDGDATSSVPSASRAMTPTAPTAEDALATTPAAATATPAAPAPAAATASRLASA